MNEMERRIKQLEADLKREKERYKNLLMHLSDEVHRWKIIRDKKGEIINWRLAEVNSKALRSWKKEEQNIIGKTAAEIFGKETIKEFKPIVKQIFQTGKPQEWSGYYKPTNQYLSMVSIPDGEYFIATGKDITKEKLAEHELKESREVLQRTEIISHQGSWKYNIQNGTWNSSKNWFRIFGYENQPDADELMEIIDPRDRQTVASAFEKAVQGIEPYNIEHRITGVSGETRWVKVSAELVRSSDGTPVSLIGATRDITEQKLAERELKESRELLQQAESISKQGSWKYDIQKDKWTFSNNWLNIFGFKDEPETEELTAIVDDRDIDKVRDAFRKAVAGLGKYSVEHRISTSPDTIKWVKVSADLLYSDDGKPSALVGAARDITEEKNAEKKLIESQDFLKRTGEIAKVGGWQLDPEIKMLNSTKVTNDLHELPEGYKISLKEAINFYHPDDRKMVSEYINEAIKHGIAYSFEARFITAKGNHKWVFAKGEPEMVNGKCVRLSGIFQDITERKKTVSRVTMLTKALDHALNGFDIVNHEGKFIYVNEAYCKMFGYSDPEELIGTNPREHCVDPTMPERIIKTLQEEGEYIFELKAKRKDGSVFDLLMHARLDHDQNGNEIYPTSSIDITKRKQAENDLAELNANLEKLVEERAEKAIRLSRELERYWLAAEHAKSGVWRYDVVTNALEWDSIMYELFGVDEDEFSGAYEAWESSLHPDDVEENVRALQETIKEQKDLDILFRIIHKKSGEVRHIRGKGKAEVNSEGEVIAVFGTNWDVTHEMQRVEEREKIIKELEVYQTAANNAEVGVWILNPKTKNSQWDETLLGIYELEEEKFHDNVVPFERYIEMVHSDDVDQVVDELKTTLQTGISMDFMFRIVTARSKTPKYIRSKAKAYRDSSGQVTTVYGTNWDITKEMELSVEKESALQKLKEAQSQLIQSEKMASLGVLTAGVAHELNNPLNYIVGGYRALKEDLQEGMSPDTDKIDEYLNWIKAGTDRAVDIVKSLNLFSRSNESSSEDCDLHLIVDDCLMVLQHKHKNRIEIEKSYSSGNVEIKGNNGKLHQAFLNLLSNAMDAIRKNGTIVIKTKTEKNTITVQIIDNGSGIKEDDMKKVRDPFFTTKPPGTGTGLGLSIAHSIIEEHGGSLSLKSKAGQGTTALVKLTKK